MLAEAKEEAPEQVSAALPARESRHNGDDPNLHETVVPVSSWSGEDRARV